MSGTKDLDEVKAMCVPIRDDYFECLHHKKEARTRARARALLVRARLVRARASPACPPFVCEQFARAAQITAQASGKGDPHH